MKIVIQRADGQVSLMQLLVEASSENIEAEIAKWKATAPGEYVSHQIVQDADVPKDRTFRNAWSLLGKQIVHDMERARKLHRENLRLMRKKKLAELDIEYQRAEEESNVQKKAEVAVKKQALRDITKNAEIDSAQTVDALKIAALGVLK